MLTDASDYFPDPQQFSFKEYSFETNETEEKQYSGAVERLAGTGENGYGKSFVKGKQRNRKKWERGLSGSSAVGQVLLGPLQLADNINNCCLAEKRTRLLHCF
ncbi:unnamed protein product [Gongylonema pulchrum]|uniref:GPATCH3 n=1 Tax=Gongylonema pulchrum TaxID=637853 RepID=A0A183EKI0_9BILA|nr:unnamed protein product [Gongylonema pulchrum]